MKPVPPHRYAKQSGLKINKTASISVGPKIALRTGLYLIWHVVRHPRTSVTFFMGEEDLNAKR